MICTSINAFHSCLYMVDDLDLNSYSIPFLAYVFCRSQCINGLTRKILSNEYALYFRHKKEQRACIVLSFLLCIYQSKMQRELLNTAKNKGKTQANRHYSGDSRLNHVALVQLRWQKFATRSLHWKLSRPAMVDLSQVLQAGLQPLGEASMHVHLGGIDLVQVPQLLQHSDALGVAPAGSHQCQ